MKQTGVTARGIVTPIFKQGDNLVEEICNSVMRAAAAEGYPIDDGDIVAVTESVVARTQGNYASTTQIATDIKTKLGGEDMGIVFPILSRNRFSILLKAISMGCKKLYVQLSYPSDEVGNALVSWDQIDAAGVNPYSDSFDEAGFRKTFGSETIHPFTGVDYVEYYKSAAPHIEVLFSNDPSYILNYTKNVLCCDIHTRERTKCILKAKGAERVCTLTEIMNASVDGSGFNAEYGLLGSNMSSDDMVKLFPENCQPVVDGIQERMKALTGKKIEAMVYGDGCFKDPVGGIWEFADPVVAPAFTAGLAGTPNELKMKYFADNEFKGLSGDELAKAMKEKIAQKDSNLVGNIAAQGTTPRRYVDLVGSLCDLVSGSGDRGTPVIHIKGYFTNFASEG